MTAENDERRPGQGAALENSGNSSNANNTENRVVPQPGEPSSVPRRRCLWCGLLYVARQTGGSSQSFCCAAHRHKFGTASRRYVTREIMAGRLMIEALKATQTSAHAVPDGDAA